MIFGLMLGGVTGWLLAHFFEIVDEGITEKNQGEMIRRFTLLMFWIVVIALAFIYYRPAP